MLHNNALNIGLDMKKVKFPYVRILNSKITEEYLEASSNTLRKQVHPSALPFYLGYKALNSEEAEQDRGQVQVLPIIMYFDIFKNYYANKQEDSFYQIVHGGDYIYTTQSTNQRAFYFNLQSKVSQKWSEIKKYNGNPPSDTIQVPTGAVYYVGFSLSSPTNINEDDVYIQIPNFIHDKNSFGNIQGSITDLLNKEFISRSSPMGANTKGYIINGTRSSEGIHTFGVQYKVEARDQQATYKKIKLSEIDDMRENILAAGRTAYECSESFITNIFKTHIDPNAIDPDRNQVYDCASPMVGLVLKTYQSDINTNWVNTEWIDGETGINAITAIDTSSGSFTLDTLNLAKKVYTMLNRIAVSDGSYNAWIQTVYTSGGLNHVETPIYLGGSSLEIEFQEVINNSGTEDQPLGTLAGRGVASNHKGGNVVFKADEPGYILCITSLTPRVDYFQGNDWDIYLNTMDDLHKPQLDGIGFQDRLFQNINANANIADLKKSIGKQPAWVEYMTNVNKTFGNFALIENEGWMCLNRVFGNIDSYTTYIFPDLYNNIFADTDITAQNFWVQIAFNMEPRRVMSAKVIPNI
jgi:hypothetical protein